MGADGNARDDVLWIVGDWVRFVADVGRIFGGFFRAGEYQEALMCYFLLLHNFHALPSLHIYYNLFSVFFHHHHV